MKGKSEHDERVELLRSCLDEVMEHRKAKLREAMEDCESHVFSDDFEKRMEEILTVKKSKKLNRMALSMAAVVVAFLICVGTVHIGSGIVNASKPEIEIEEWLEDFFVVDAETARNEAVDFDATVLDSFLEENGFVKDFERIGITLKNYMYTNNAGEYIALQITRTRVKINIDNTEVECSIGINAVGKEYLFVDRLNDAKKNLLWKDEENRYYFLTSTLNKEDIIAIMNKICN